MVWWIPTELVSFVLGEDPLSTLRLDEDPFRRMVLVTIKNETTVELEARSVHTHIPQSDPASYSTWNS